MSLFLDNTGDIVLDAVLTDYGRQLLARGDGSFKIVKFALGDDEIDYSLFDPALETTLRDQKIFQTPILEAMTNNAASMKSKLLTITTKNLLFLPVLQLNQKAGDVVKTNTFFDTNYVGYTVPVDTDTYNALTASLGTNNNTRGILWNNKNQIRIDQGLDSADTLKTVTLLDSSPDLNENEYSIIMDNRFGMLKDKDYNSTTLTPTVDDDQMATWKLTRDVNSLFVTNMAAAPQSGNDTELTDLKGTRGTKLMFSISAQTSLINGNYFSKYGLPVKKSGSTTYNFQIIKTVVKISGAQTGYSLDIPVAFVKKV